MGKLKTIAEIGKRVALWLTHFHAWQVLERRVRGEVHLRTKIIVEYRVEKCGICGRVRRRDEVVRDAPCWRPGVFPFDMAEWEFRTAPKWASVPRITSVVTRPTGKSSEI